MAQATVTPIMPPPDPADTLTPSIGLTLQEYTQVFVALTAASLLTQPAPHGNPRDPDDVQRAIDRALDLLGAAWARTVRQ